MFKNILFMSLMSLVTLFGCSTTPADKQLLPDSGPTTVEIVEGSRPQHNYYGGDHQSTFIGDTIAPHYNAPSQYTNEHVQELKRDFKRVPNPEIVGYVYPHINNNRMPVPGYYTTFTLYDRNHFALTSEGHND